jgi:hypothetical protein
MSTKRKSSQARTHLKSKLSFTTLGMISNQRLKVFKILMTSDRLEELPKNRSMIQILSNPEGQFSSQINPLLLSVTSQTPLHYNMGASLIEPNKQAQLNLQKTFLLKASFNLNLCQLLSYFQDTAISSRLHFKDISHSIPSIKWTNSCLVSLMNSRTSVIVLRWKT